MKKRLLVSGYCQVVGMRQALAVLLPQFDVEYTALPHGSDDAFVAELQAGDMWACADTFPGIEHYSPNVGGGAVFVWPQVTFSGFHPDTVLAWSDDTQLQPVGTPYNSALLLWAYVNGLPEAAAISLFSDSTFASLGYYEYFAQSIDGLRKQMEGCGLNFDRFFKAIKRTGVFMHSYDHAKMGAIVEVARQVATVIAGSRPEYENPIEQIVDDALLHNTIWPVYPEVGARFGVRGSYRWKILQTYVPSLEAYVLLAYEAYRSYQVTRETVRCARFDDGLYDRVLGSKTARSVALAS